MLHGYSTDETKGFYLRVISIISVAKNVAKGEKVWV